MTLRPFLAAALLTLSACRPSSDHDPTLILISIDGFRADYLDTFEPPTLTGLAEEGVWAPGGLVPVFPTKTFPNHYSIATGLYPANNGMVANTMYDPDKDRWFRIGDRDEVESSFWWEGEPIWVTAELQEQTSATYFWVGSEAPVKGVRPTYWYRHDASVPNDERVDQVLDWIDLPKAERPTVITLYFSEVDTKGHLHGPDSEENRRAVADVDASLGRLVAGVRDRGLQEHVNFVVVSDHGMQDVDPDRSTFLEDYVDLEAGLFVTYSPILAIRPSPGREAELRDGLRRMPGLKLFSQEDLSARHYTGHHRIPGIVGVAEDGWTIYSSRDFRERAGPPSPGNHGFDSNSPSMRGLFIASGPAFRRGLEVEPFENVHLYNLMTRVVGLDPAPNDGDFGVIESFLR